MNAQDFRSLQEAYMEVVRNQQLDEVLDTPEKAQEYAKKNVKSMVGAFVKGAANKDISQLKTIEKRKRGAELAKRKAERKAAEEMKEGRVPWNDPKNPLESGHTPAEKNRAKRERTGVEDLSKSPSDKQYARYGAMKSVDDEQSSVKRKDKPHKFRDLPIRTDKGKKQTLGQMRRTRGTPKPGASDEKSNLYQSPIRKDDKRTRGGKTDQWQGPNPRNEEVDIYDIILSHLLDEGYAETVEAAEVMMVNMSEELTGERKERALKKGGYLATRVATGREGQPVERRSRSGGDITMRTTTKAPTKRGGGGEKGKRKSDWSGWEADRGSKKRTQKEQVDIYDIILSHLLDEGYAETPAAAEAIMVNMSEEWRQSILG